MFRPTPADERGFTLIELLIVIAILGLIAGIALPIFLNTLNDHRQKSYRESSEAIAAFYHEWSSEGYVVIVGSGAQTGYLLAQDESGQVLSKIKIGPTGNGAVSYSVRYLTSEFPTGGWSSAHGSNSGSSLLVNAHNITDVTYDAEGHVLTFAVTGLAGVLPAGYDLGELQLRFRAGALTDGSGLTSETYTATNNQVGFKQGDTNSNFYAAQSADGDKLTVTAYLDSTTAAWMDSQMNMRSQTVMPNVTDDILDLSFSLWQGPAEALTPIIAIQ